MKTQPLNPVLPNILFLIADDLRHDALGAAGNAEVYTPNLDRLASDGMRFRNACIQGGSHGAVCMPSRAMLHTGRSQFEIDGGGQTIATNHEMLGECLSRAGYHTHGIGKWHNDSTSYARSFQSGSEIFFRGMEDPWNMPLSNFDPNGHYSARIVKCLEPFLSNRTESYPADHIHAGKHASEIFADAACAFLESEDARHPFFCYVAFTAPHDPRIAPQKFHEMYAKRNINIPPNFLPEHPFDYGQRTQRDERIEPYPRTPESVIGHIRDYYAMISHFDHCVGRILDTLDKCGMAENTLVVLTADHGLALGQHGLMGKQCLYDHSVRVPLLFRGPGVPRGVVRDDFAFVRDSYPTLCGLAGLPVPPTVTARDLLASPVGPEEIYLSYASTVRGLRGRRYKLLEYSGPAAGRIQLFDLETDPWETDNLADKPEFAPMITKMRGRLRQFRDAEGDCRTGHGKEFWDGLSEACMGVP
jgi:arylsulfatase A-like enzyme